MTNPFEKVKKVVQGLKYEQGAMDIMTENQAEASRLRESIEKALEEKGERGHVEVFTESDEKGLKINFKGEVGGKQIEGSFVGRGTKKEEDPFAIFQETISVNIDGQDLSLQEAESFVEDYFDIIWTTKLQEDVLADGREEN